MITYGELINYPMNEREAVLAAAFAEYLGMQIELPIEEPDSETT